MPDVVLLMLADPSTTTSRPRVPVMACLDALASAGTQARLTQAQDDNELDNATKPVESGDARLIIAAATDAEVRAVLRRLTRRYAPPPSKRPAELQADRTMFDLPPIAILPLAPAIPPLVTALDLPVDPTSVATAVLGGHQRRVDLFRTDAGSITLHGCLLGGLDANGKAALWQAKIEVDDATLTDGEDPIAACAIRNAGRSSVDGLPLITDATPDDGLIDVAVAIPTLSRRLLRTRLTYEVRRCRGRAVSVTPRAVDVPITDDGADHVLNRKRTWWMERGAWAAYVNGHTP